MATRINHPSVATLFDFSTLDDGSNYMVWEYIEGINLHELIDQRGPLSPRYAAMLATQALMGFDAIHRAGIVHRDVSPENLMITRGPDGDERVKIIDLGIAKQSGTEEDKTKTGMFVGKWKYCSPEHLGMLPPGERIDGRADIYSFGIVLYEMLTGVPPFQADTPHAYLMLHSQTQPRALRDVNPGVTAPGEFEALIFRALEKDRSKRFATAREFAQAIEALLPTLSDTPGAAAPVPIAAEVTDEATRVAPRASDAVTVVSVSDQERTVRKTGGAPASPVPAVHRTLQRDEVDDGGQPTARKRSRVPAVLGAILALAVAVGAFVMRRDTPKSIEKPVPAPANVAASVLPVAEPLPNGHLAINAFPWANVVSVRNLQNGESVNLGAGASTPLALELPPGRYEVTLANPNVQAPTTETVSVPAAGEASVSARFGDPAAALPDFLATASSAGMESGATPAGAGQ